MEDSLIAGSSGHSAVPQKYPLLSMKKLAVISGIYVWDVLAMVCWVNADGRIVLLGHPSQGPLRRSLPSGLSAEVALGCFLPQELCSRERSNWHRCMGAGCKYLFRDNLNLGIISLD